jgi:hypothetical protein
MVTYLAGNRIRGTNTERLALEQPISGSITIDPTGGNSSTPSNGASSINGQAIIENGTTGGQVTSGTFSSFVVGNNTNRALIVASGTYNYHPDIVGITFNGSESFAKIKEHDDGNFKVELWILYNPTVTTANVVIDWGTGAGQLGAICYSFYNVKQSSAFGTPVIKTSSASTSPFIPITPTTTGSMIIDSYYSGTDGAVPNNALTDGMNVICAGVDRSMASQYSLTPTIGSVNNMSRVTANGTYVQTAVEIKKATGYEVVDGSIFYETDTNKEYVLYNNTWTEL